MNPRFSIIPAGAVTDARLEPRDLQVLCLLGRHIDDYGWCCRSQVKMAAELNCGRATVQRALGRLVDTGYVEHRPKKRASGADAAHDYRVIIDPPAAPARAAEIATEGVPTDGQGVPIDGQGVPTHERAPMLTPPAERIERESAGARGESVGEEPIADRAQGGKSAKGRTIVTFRGIWPTSHIDDRAKTEAAWQALTPEERDLAIDHARGFLAEFERHGRGRKPAGWTYLGQKPWEIAAERAAAEAAKPAAPAQIMVAAYSRLWWWQFWQKVDAGEKTGLMVQFAQAGTGWSMAAEDAPGEADLDRLWRQHRDADGAKAWRREMHKRGVYVPVPAVAEFVWTPAEWPEESLSPQHGNTRVGGLAGEAEPGGDAARSGDDSISDMAEEQIA